MRRSATFARLALALGGFLFNLAKTLFGALRLDLLFFGEKWSVESDFGKSKLILLEIKSGRRELKILS